MSNEVIEFLFDEESLSNQFKSTGQMDTRGITIVEDSLMTSQRSRDKAAIAVAEDALNQSSVLTALERRSVIATQGMQEYFNK